jgi:hypothetical protein
MAREVVDESYRSYQRTMHARLARVSLLLDIFIAILEEGAVVFL